MRSVRSDVSVALQSTETINRPLGVAFQEDLFQGLAAYCDQMLGGSKTVTLHYFVL